MSDLDCEKEFDKYKKYLSSCLKTPSLTKEQEKELEKVLEGIIQSCLVGDLSVKKKDSTE